MGVVALLITAATWSLLVLALFLYDAGVLDRDKTDEPAGRPDSRFFHRQIKNVNISSGVSLWSCPSCDHSYSFDRGYVRCSGCGVWLVRGSFFTHMFSHPPSSGYRKVLDKEPGYVLLEFVFPEVDPRPRCLAMKNGSTGELHFELVHPDCEDVQDALNYRAFGDVEFEEDWKPEKIT